MLVTDMKAHWLLILVLFALSPARTFAEEIPAKPAATNLTVAPYLRITDSTNGTIELQVAIRRLAPKEDKGTELLLAAVTHIGETNYFTNLQKQMARYELVLFEGIMPAKRSKGAWTGKEFETIRSMSAQEDAEAGNLQVELARALKLAFQLSAISYDKPNYRNSDLSVEAMQRILMGPPSKGPAKPAPEGQERGDESLTKLMQLMQGEGFLGKLVIMGVQIIASNPHLQAVTKLTFVETLGRVRGDLAKAHAMPPELARLFEVIIHSRNQKVVDDVIDELRKKSPPKSIAVFYGAGHMDDLERRLREELNYKPKGDTWLPALKVDLKEGGISKFQLQMIRFMVQQQMRMLFPEEQK
tara:strand:- start:2931 stop:4001 length:1071 start_codon:yes stop_codon:yes gene_type:complete